MVVALDRARRLVTALLQLDRLKSPERFGAWLAGIGRVLSLRALRERGASRIQLTRSGSLPDTLADADAGAEPDRARTRARAQRGARRVAVSGPIAQRRCA